MPARMRLLTLVAGSVLLLLVGCGPRVAATGALDGAAAGSGQDGRSAPSAGDASARAPAAPGDMVGPDVDRARAPVAGAVAEPVEVEIPAIAVSADVIDLGLNADRSLAVPSDVDRAGWYTGRPPPGAVGPAVIVGHVDSRDGPAVFHRLRELAPGDDVLVHREDASTVTFVVDRVEQHAKDDFPTRAVYGPTRDATLRLITCGGSFDRQRGSYDGNVVVFATLDAS